jgi:predicted transcriptional regulator
VRQLFGQPQTELAERLHKDQGFISRLEHQGDALMSTVRDYIEALGGEMRLMVRFDGVEVPVDLSGRVAPTRKRAGA